MGKEREKTTVVGEKKPANQKKNNEKSVYNSSPKMAPVPKKGKMRKSKKEKRRKGIIITSVADETLTVFLEAQEKVMRRVAEQHNVHVVEVFKVFGNVLDSKKLMRQIKEFVEINEYEVILTQSRYRLSTNICDILDFEIFIVEHGAEIIYL
ncbi:MAG: recombinase family protein [Erysipelotrichaceae bacterium]|nr:recombinase family protein [Erysipelotrichaceae bacterium]